MYGREGAGPTSVFLGDEISGHMHLVQAPGHGLRIRREAIVGAMLRCEPLKALLRRYVDAFAVQVSHAALSSTAPMPIRLARLLLMYDDRLRTHVLPLTQKLLSDIIVGPEDPVAVLARFAGEGLLEASTSSVRILDRGRLQVLAGAAYGHPESEYDRLVARSTLHPVRFTQYFYHGLSAAPTR